MDLLYVLLGAYLDRVSFSGPNVELEPDPMFNLSAALHELADNAVKHGSLSRPKGQLDLSWSVSRTERGMTLTLDWVEKNGPPARRPRRLGFGSRLIGAGHRAAVERRGASHLHAQRPLGAHDRAADPRTLAERGSAGQPHRALRGNSGNRRSRVHVFGEPVGRQIVAGAAFLGLAVEQRARRGELIAEAEIVDESR